MGKMKEYKAGLVIREMPDGETVVVAAQAHDATGHLLYDIVMKRMGPPQEKKPEPEKEIGPDEAQSGPGEGEPKMTPATDVAAMPPPVPAELL